MNQTVPKASYATPAKANVDEKNMSHIGNYSYCLIRNKTAAKIYVNSGTEKTGVIPTKINGIPVKEIGCVDSDVKWEKLIVSDGIEVIDAKAFMGLSHLKEYASARTWNISVNMLFRVAEN